MFRVTPVLLAALASTACDPRVALLVQLRTDWVPGEEAARAVVTVSDLDGHALARADRALSSSDDLIAGERVADFTGLALGRYAVRVDLLERGDATLGGRRLLVDLDRASAVSVVVTRSCAGVVCPGGGDPTATECLGARCVPPECGPDDPAACPPPECAADAECPGGSACAVPRCVDGVCLLAADDARCAPSMFCAPGTGCLPRQGLDAGPMDAGSSDAGPIPDGGVGLDGGGSPCGASTDCAVDEECHPDRGVCVPSRACVTATACPSGYLCSGGVRRVCVRPGLAAAGGACAAHADCASASCDATTGTCQTPCSFDVMCDPGSRCGARPGLGTVCVSCPACEEGLLPRWAESGACDCVDWRPCLSAAACLTAQDCVQTDVGGNRCVDVDSCTNSEIRVELADGGVRCASPLGCFPDVECGAPTRCRDVDGQHLCVH